jgi:hypothetical protein
MLCPYTVPPPPKRVWDAPVRQPGRLHAHARPLHLPQLPRRRHDRLRAVQGMNYPSIPLPQPCRPRPLSPLPQLAPSPCSSWLPARHSQGQGLLSPAAAQRLTWLRGALRELRAAVAAPEAEAPYAGAARCSSNRCAGRAMGCGRQGVRASACFALGRAGAPAATAPASCCARPAPAPACASPTSRRCAAMRPAARCRA